MVKDEMVYLRHTIDTALSVYRVWILIRMKNDILFNSLEIDFL